MRHWLSYKCRWFDTRKKRDQSIIDTSHQRTQAGFLISLVRNLITYNRWKSGHSVSWSKKSIKVWNSEKKTYIALCVVIRVKHGRFFLYVRVITDLRLSRKHVLACFPLQSYNQIDVFNGWVYHFQMDKILIIRKPWHIKLYNYHTSFNILTSQYLAILQIGWTLWKSMFIFNSAYIKLYGEKEQITCHEKMKIKTQADITLEW